MQAVHSLHEKRRSGLRRISIIGGIDCGRFMTLVVVLGIVGALIGGQNTSQQGTQSSSSESNSKPSGSANKIISKIKPRLRKTQTLI
jgi:hypothetical protein